MRVTDLVVPLPSLPVRFAPGEERRGARLIRWPVHRSGFVALVGRPSTGKSTLLNRLLGQKIAIVSPKPQTTRGRILGVLHGAEATRLALVDTPGLHDENKGLSAALNETAEQAARGADAIALVVDVSALWRGPIPRLAEELLARVKPSDRPIALILNKVDLVPKPRLLPLIEDWSPRARLRAHLPALRADGRQHRRAAGGAGHSPCCRRGRASSRRRRSRTRRSAAWRLSSSASRSTA